MKYTNMISLLIIEVIILSLPATTVTANNALPSYTSTGLPSDVKSILWDYSQFMSTGNTLNDLSYSQSMLNLVTERRNFYIEYYSLGLRSEEHTSELQS